MPRTNVVLSFEVDCFETIPLLQLRGFVFGKITVTIVLESTKEIKSILLLLWLKVNNGLGLHTVKELLSLALASQLLFLGLFCLND